MGINSKSKRSFYTNSEGRQIEGSYALVLQFLPLMLETFGAFLAYTQSTEPSLSSSILDRLKSSSSGERITGMSRRFLFRGTCTRSAHVLPFCVIQNLLVRGSISYPLRMEWNETERMEGRECVTSFESKHNVRICGTCMLSSQGMSEGRDYSPVGETHRQPSHAPCQHSTRETIK